MNRRAFMLTTTAASFGAFVGTAFADDTTASTAASSVEVAELAIGDADAPIEVIEYASYTCSHCANFHRDVFVPLKNDYIDTGKVRFVFREVYFDKFGLWASMVARCGGDMRYFGIQKLLFDEQSDWLSGGKDTMQIVENLRKIGKKAGLTDENLDACLNDGDMAAAMYAKFTKEIEEHNIDATPTLIINGEKHKNMRYESLKKILDAKLAQ